MTQSGVPSYESFYEPTFQALRELGGSASVEELNRKTIELMNLTEDQISVVHRGTITKVEYRLAWARTDLKRCGYIVNTARAIWTMTALGSSVDSIKQKEILDTLRSISPKKSKKKEFDDTNGDQPQLDMGGESDWQSDVLNELLALSPSSFEKFAQLLLRESGFIEVKVTGKTADGGIDGNGIIRFAELVSFPVVFQCKRYTGSVSAEQIRNFRGAMQGRAEKGLVITTGTFTQHAYKEATRDGAPVIDLVDGDLLVKKIKELRLGVKIEMVEKITVDHDWFAKTFGNVPAQKI